MAGLEQAASAFETDINGGSPRETVGATETVFSNSFEGIEVDDGSPAKGGGDDTLPEGVDPRLVEEDQGGRRPKAKERASKSEDDEGFDPFSDDVLYADDEKEPKKEGEEEDDEEDENEDNEELDPEALESKVKVTIDGVEEEVSVREALDGYIRQQTFHRRMTELDQGRQEVETEARRVVASRTEAAAALAEAQEVLESILPKITQEEWDQAFAKDPAKARAMQRSYQEIQAKIDDVKAKRANVDRGTNEQQVQQTNGWIKKEAQRFADANPQWGQGDEGAKKRQKDLSSMARTAKAIGFSDDEILGVYDSRMLQVLLKASRYDRMMAARPKPSNGIKTAKPGAGRKSTAPRGMSRAVSDLERTGSLQAAGAVFSELIRPPSTRRR